METLDWSERVPENVLTDSNGVTGTLERPTQLGPTRGDALGLRLAALIAVVRRIERARLSRARLLSRTSAPRVHEWVASPTSAGAANRP